MTLKMCFINRTHSDTGRPLTHYATSSLGTLAYIPPSQVRFIRAMSVFIVLLKNTTKQLEVTELGFEPGSSRSKDQRSTNRAIRADKCPPNAHRVYLLCQQNAHHVYISFATAVHSSSNSRPTISCRLSN